MGDIPRYPHSRLSPQKGQGSYNRRPRSHGFNLYQTIESDFSKRRNLKNINNKWSLPRPQDLFKTKVWQNNHMLLSKQELNSVKNLLSDFNMKDWHNHTRKTNHAGDVVNIVRKKISPELLTQAWCKFYEAVSSYDLVPEVAATTGCLNSLHLCEAPGAFITALNHFLKLRLPHVRWQWRASTLNPYYEGNKLSFMINDDRFILHTLDFWEFGQDQSGDMFKEENINALIEVSNRLAPIHLVTADGSIDCQSDPGEQEGIVSPLHYCETLVALSVLSQGGSFLLKVFTIFESPTICLMYLLSCVFDNVNFFKPATSKEGNSEVYVICLNFHGPSAIEPYLSVFRKFFSQSNDKAMFSEDQISLEFFCKITECADYFKGLQVSVLKRNLQTYSSPLTNEDETKQFQIKRRLAYSYLERYRLEPLSLPDDYIVGNDIIKQTLTLNLDPRNEEWTLAEKKSHDTSNMENVLLGLKSMLDMMKTVWPQNSEPVFSFATDELHKGLDLSLNPVFGMPVMTVYSSKFCLGSFLNVWNRLCEIKRVEIHNALDFEEVMDGFVELDASMKYNPLSVKVCDMRDVDYGGNVCKFETECLGRLIQLLKVLKEDEHLILVGFPLLTRVSVGLVFYIAQIFEKIYFKDPITGGYCVLFFSKRSLNSLPVLIELHKRMSEENKLALHSFIPVTLLVRDPDWYRCIHSINQIHVKNIVSNLIQELLFDLPPHIEVSSQDI